LLHAELARAVLDEHVELLERALVHQELDALARSELAALVLRLDARLAAAFARARTPRFELVDDVLHGVARPRIADRQGIARRHYDCDARPTAANATPSAAQQLHHPRRRLHLGLAIG